MANKVTGSCHCGLVRFELNGNPKFTVNCHCDDCKKRNGSAFSTYVGVVEKDLLLIGGESYLKKYKVENSGEKYFCSECGSPIFNKNYRIHGMYLLFYGAFTQPSTFTPSVNVFCSTKSNWVDGINNIKSFTGSVER